MKKLFPGIIIALSICILQLFALPKAGLTWDEPSVFLIGRANMKFWQSLDRSYLDNLGNEKYFNDNPMYYMFGAEYYPPFSYTISAVTSALFAETLGLVSVVDGYHIGGLLITTVGIFAFYGIAVTVGLSAFVASLTTLMFALYPTIIGQMRNDAKDAPLMSMVTIFVFVFLVFVKYWKTSGDLTRILLAAMSGIMMGFAAAIKPTAFIILAVMFVWVVFAIQDSKSFYKRIKPARRLLLLLPFIAVLSIVAFVASWPWLWSDPLGNLMESWEFFKTVGFHMPVPYFGKIYKAGISVPLHYTLGILAVQTPVGLLILALIGSVYAVWAGRNDNPYPLLFVFWFVVPLSRFWFDGVIIYAKIRQFIEVMPAFFILAGFGLQVVSDRGAELLRLTKQKVLVTRGRQIAAASVAGVMLLHEAWIIGSFFPYEPSYFNALVGGTKNVSEQELFDVEYWGSGMREAIEWIEMKEAHAPTTVYACLMRHLAINHASENTTIVGLGEGSKYTAVPNSPSWFGGTIEFLSQYQTLVHTIERRGAPLFYIYENTAPLVWRCGWESPITSKHK